MRSDVYQLYKMPHLKVQLFLIIALFTSSLAHLISIYKCSLISMFESSESFQRSVKFNDFLYIFFWIFFHNFFLPNRKNTEQSGLIKNYYFHFQSCFYCVFHCQLLRISFRYQKLLLQYPL